jgi:uncharacterized RDD family membrane protein YckC
VTINFLRKKQAPPPTFKGHYAGFVTRFVAMVIDSLIISVSIGIMLGTAALILNFFNIDIQAITAGTSSMNTFVRNVTLFLTSFAFTFLVNMVYCVVLWNIAGKTIGKAVMGVRVIGPKGTRVTIGRGIRRYIGYWISAIPLFLGYFWVLINDHRHAWHDMLAGTSVIYDYEAQYVEGALGRLAQYAPQVEAKMVKKSLPAGEKQAVLPSGQPVEPQQEHKE